ncbi:MAG: RdgB/HAM1 family non-canonical purine NTP pyrophosphatase [Acidobacteria bacterium]|nr:RdgB/HAM1 family non-canonical purine NTP pyrophosphatase [Acidobacteriota bacterium]
MILHCATTNPGKLKEFQLAAGHFGVAFDVRVLPGLSGIEPPEETGGTFTENAVIKASYYSQFTGQYLFCDDSGLVIDALNGEPGVRSARYAGVHGGDKANNELVKQKMRGQANRAGRFVCVLALARGGEIVETFEGVVEGQILDEERGTGGFGYDPLFYHPPFGCTLAEASDSQKMSVSHRGEALAKMFRFLMEQRAEE